MHYDTYSTYCTYRLYVVYRAENDDILLLSVFIEGEK